jgi:hypothetical protein
MFQNHANAAKKQNCNQSVPNLTKMLQTNKLNAANMLQTCFQCFKQSWSDAANIFKHLTSKLVSCFKAEPH